MCINLSIKKLINLITLSKLPVNDALADTVNKKTLYLTSPENKDKLSAKGKSPYGPNRSQRS